MYLFSAVADCMEHFWIASFASLTFVALVSSSQEILVETGCDSCDWDWVVIKPPLDPTLDIAGVSLYVKNM